MNTAGFVLILTLHASGQHGPVDVPIQNQFATRADCVGYLDEQIQAARRAFKGPLRITLITHCELREVRK